jgi:hypothetical protein
MNNAAGVGKFQGRLPTILGSRLQPENLLAQALAKASNPCLDVLHPEASTAR